MRKFVLAIVVVLLAALFAQEVEAARWKIHATGPSFRFKVWGTVNCQAYGPPLCTGTAIPCQTYSGWIPPWANDIGIQGWPSWCPINEVKKKVAVPEYQDGRGQWVFLPLAAWLEDNLTEEMSLPSISDSTTTFLEVHMVTDLAEWLADPRPHQEVYEIVDGECDDLPGYLIGTTPITFNPSAGPGESPFGTTPLTGTLWLDGETMFTPDEQVGANPDIQLAMHVIPVDDYLDCSTVCPFDCMEMENSILPEDLSEAGYCTIAFLAYGFTEITALEYCITGFPTGEEAPPLPIVEYCPETSLVMGDPLAGGGIQAFGETIEPLIPWSGTFCFAYTRINAISYMGWWPMTLSYCPSVHTYPADPHNFAVGPDPDYLESPTLAEHGCTVGGQHWEALPYEGCMGPTQRKPSTWGEVKERYR